jgi:putative transposase
LSSICDNQRYRKSLNNLTLADDNGGRTTAVIKQREMIRRQTIEHLRLQHRKLAA